MKDKTVKTAFYKNNLIILLLISVLTFTAWSADDFDDFGDEFSDEKVVTGKDPLEPINRGVFYVNDKLMVHVLSPTAKGYGKVVPKNGRIWIKNAYNNVNFPIRFVNNLLQFKGKETVVETGRFLVNTTAGVLGTADRAEQWFGWKQYDEDFGQTLAFYGVGDAVPLQLPLLGPSNIRDTVGIVVDSLYNPLNWIECSKLKYTLKAEKIVNNQSLVTGLYERSKKEAMDPYAYFRDVYKQNREKEIGE